MIHTIFNFNKAPDLPPQLQWKYSAEPELLEWAIRARNYNTFVANCMLAFMAAITLGGSFIMYSVYEGMSQPWRTLSCVFFFFFILFTISCMTHQRVSFAYRFTKSGIEYCEWKSPAKWTLTFVKWFAGVTAIIFIFLATIDPVFLIGAMVGPGGMGLMYLSMANSKNYQNLHTEYHHHFLQWKELKKLIISTNRNMVELEYGVPQKNSKHLALGSLYVFFDSQREEATDIIKSNLPLEATCTTEKVDVLN
ncbi:hypothetical protein [Pseudomonas sp. TH43]|uniref:hypothetical protein n=1 Tax=Pseudomonas sp. TH43 TaxID=2796407 RepID=UPI001A91D482|nr:hypothetical protein [Pseudomonas sp. TH43]